MKKKLSIPTILLVLLSLTSCTRSDEDVFSGVFIAVTITVAVLNIILFFKVWGMTNDVAALRKKFAPEYFPENKIKETQNDIQNFAIGERVNSKSLNKTGVVENFYNGIYKVNIEGQTYILRDEDLEKIDQ